MTATQLRPAALPEPPSPPQTPRPGRSYLVAIGLYVAVRFVGVVMLAVQGAYQGSTLADRLTSWDGQWYLAIARDGYGGVPASMVDAAGQHTANTALAFFPGYPTLVHLVSAGTGIGLIPAALLISLLAGVAAAGAVFRIARLVDGRNSVGYLLVVLWAGAPMAITLSMAYTEALFTAAAAWALVGVLERRWPLAALACVVAGLVRPTAFVPIVVVVLAGLVVVWRGQGRQSWWAAVCLPVSCAGLVGYLCYVANVTGHLAGWFDIERAGWTTRFDLGQGSAKFVWGTLMTGDSVMQVGNVAVLLGAVVLAVVLARLRLPRIPWPLVAYGIGMVAFVSGSSGVDFAKVRFLVPAFTLLLPLAIGLANRRRATMIATTIGFVLVGCWFSAYALTGWQYAI